MALELSKARIMLVSVVLLAGMAALAVALQPKPLPLPLPAPVAACTPAPPNLIVLSPALSRSAITQAVASNQLPAKLATQGAAPGTTLHRYETGTTGGFIALRGRCVAAHHLSWVR